jgi:hypothetical protein
MKGRSPVSARNERRGFEILQQWFESPDTSQTNAIDVKNTGREIMSLDNEGRKRNSPVGTVFSDDFCQDHFRSLRVSDWLRFPTR